MDYATKIRTTGVALADAVKKTIDMENRRHVVKLACIDRIMKAGDNPLTGKAHSFSSAEAAVAADAEYLAYLDTLSTAIREKLVAEAEFAAAKAAARLVALEAAA